MTNQPSVAEQIAANEQTDQARTERASRLLALSLEDMKIVLDNEEFEGQPTTDDEDELLAKMLEQHTQDQTQEEQATQEELEAAAEEALKPELKSIEDGPQPKESDGCNTENFDPGLDNPLKPKMTKGEEQQVEQQLSEEEKQALIEKQKKANRATLKNNRRAAKEWIGKKKGLGVLLARDPDGRIHSLVLGDEESISTTELTVTDPLFQMILTLMLSHIPGASVNSQVMHAQQLEALNNVANHIMQGLQATNNNVIQLVSFLKLKFPELQTEMQPMQQTQSGILVPGKA